MDITGFVRQFPLTSTTKSTKPKPCDNLQEDARLKQLVRVYGAANWSVLAQVLSLLLTALWVNMFSMYWLYAVFEQQPSQKRQELQAKVWKSASLAS